MAMTIMGFISDHHLAEVFILLVGFIGMVLIFERVKALYFDFTISTQEFMKSITSLLHEDKIDEAIAICSNHSSKPLAHVIKRVLERSDREPHAVNMSYDIATSEMAPRLSKNLSHLPMLSNVVTLIGLLGTVVGLILAFNALSFAEPSQRQALLTQGISLAMTATAAGLCVAIPLMFIYSFLYTRQNRLFSEIDENTMKVIEILNDRGHVVSEAAVYPSHSEPANKTAPPPPKKKVS